VQDERSQAQDLLQAVHGPTVNSLQRHAGSVRQGYGRRGYGGWVMGGRPTGSRPTGSRVIGSRVIGSRVMSPEASMSQGKGHPREGFVEHHIIEGLV
jgi:hypothetical protein